MIPYTKVLGRVLVCKSGTASKQYLSGVEFLCVGCEIGFLFSIQIDHGSSQESEIECFY